MKVVIVRPHTDSKRFLLTTSDTCRYMIEAEWRKKSRDFRRVNSNTMNIFDDILELWPTLPNSRAKVPLWWCTQFCYMFTLLLPSYCDEYLQKYPLIWPLIEKFYHKYWQDLCVRVEKWVQSSCDEISDSFLSLSVFYSHLITIMAEAY